MFNFRFANKSNPSIRFISLVPAVNTLYPIIESNKLNRDWIEKEKSEYEIRKSKCPFSKFIKGPGSSNLVSSINKCPAIHGIMNQGFIVRCPADFKVQTTGDNQTLLLEHKNIISHTEYVTFHDEEVSKWLLDSTKDTTMPKVLKINTPWRIITNDDDIVFLVTKVPFVNESRFSAVMGILDPTIAYEVNIQLFWHVLQGEEIIKAGTPLCQYIPISRKLLNSISFTCEDATQNDYKAENEMIYSYEHTYPQHNSFVARVSRVSKIMKKYYGSN